MHEPGVTRVPLAGAAGQGGGAELAQCDGGLGVVTLVWQHGVGSQAIWGIPVSGSIPSWLPLMVFAFLFGLSMDYEVFILARVREEHDAGVSTDGAVVTGIGRTGRLVTSAAMIMFLGFVAIAQRPEHAGEDDRHRAGSRDHPRRDARPRPARARGDVPVREV